MPHKQTTTGRRGSDNGTSRKDVARAAMWVAAARETADEVSPERFRAITETALAYAGDMGALSRNARSLLTLYQKTNERIAMATALREAADLCDSSPHKTMMLAVATGLEKGSMAHITGTA